jgi:citrate lyase subunit beta / citryl-CoA lyase
MRLRSPLFAPGDSGRKSGKAIESNADAVILDLEDSVAAPAKEAARHTVTQTLRELGNHPRRHDVIVRVNPRGTPWYLGDLAAVVPAAPAALMLPKCTGADDLCALDHHLEALETAAGLPPGDVKVIAIVTETAASVLALPTYTTVGPRLIAMAFGAEDFSADLGLAPRRPDGTYHPAAVAARAAVITTAAAIGIPALDTPWPDPRDPDGLRREAEAAVTDGFAGKIVIHPAQIDIVNAAFTPNPEQIRWAQRVRDGFAANPGAGVFSLDGKMIDRPHQKLAERILAAGGL